VNAQTKIEAPVRIERLRGFITSLAELVATTPREGELLEAGALLLEGLIAHDDWLPDVFARSSSEGYRQYLLHCDSRERFSVVSFVWGPGQGTPVHDHRVWGLVGVLRGAEQVENYRRRQGRGLEQVGQSAILNQGEVEVLSPRKGDIHRVSNARKDGVSVSIHVYGGNIGAVERATFDAAGSPRRFISGYANDVLPNLWDRSRTA
jgi:predicted metal-dependent enzyme (double-stranded beta helix superfamily)